MGLWQTSPQVLSRDGDEDQSTAAACIVGALALESGTQLGHFLVERNLGVGGMAEVYKAHDQKLGRDVALKILPPDVARDETLFARFKSEVKQIARLTHPNIVTLYEYGREGPYIYYSMQLLPGGDLASRIRKGALPPREAYRIFCRMLDALACAHQLNIVHRDIKPENILFSEEGQPVLTDFGIGKIITDAGGITKTGMTVGTPAYISPEQARGKPVDARTDLYALGVVFYEMLTGQVPFRGTDAMQTIMKHLSEPPPPLPENCRAYQAIVSKLMAKNPDDRPQSAAQLIRALQKRSSAAARPESAQSTQSEPVAPASAPEVAARSSSAPAAATGPTEPTVPPKPTPQPAAPARKAPPSVQNRFVLTRLHILVAVIIAAAVAALVFTL